MGDRANIVMKQDGNAEIYLYTHWSGYELPKTLQAALKRGKDRWNDQPYLGRVIFNEMTKGNENQVTGFGLTTYLTDNTVNRPLLVVDSEAQRVSLRTEDGKAVGNTWTFENFCTMDLGKNAWATLQGRDEE